LDSLDVHFIPESGNAPLRRAPDARISPGIPMRMDLVQYEQAYRRGQVGVLARPVDLLYHL